MLRLFLSSLLAVMLSLMSVTASAHAAGMAASVSDAQHDMVMASVADNDADCGDHQHSGAGRDLLCEFACTTNTVMAGAGPVSSVAVGRPAAFPAPGPMPRPERAPAQPERPPEQVTTRS